MTSQVCEHMKADPSLHYDSRFVCSNCGACHEDIETKTVYQPFASHFVDDISVKNHCTKCGRKWTVLLPNA